MHVTACLYMSIYYTQLNVKTDDIVYIESTFSHAFETLNILINIVF